MIAFYLTYHAVSVKTRIDEYEEIQDELEK
jgi:hypothetical protein